MMIELLQPYISEIITAIISAFVAWFFSRKKQQMEVQANELDNVEKAVRIYREVADDLSKQLKTAITELNEAKKELDEARQTIKELEQKVEALTNELTKYKQLNGKTKV